MLLSMSFNYTLLHLTLYFVAFCLAFCSISPRVSLHFALRFGAYCSAFWCILPCVLVQNAMRFDAKCVATTSDKLPFSSSCGCKFGRIFLQREMQKHSKWLKTVGISTQKMPKFYRLGAFYMAFSGYFLLEWFGRKTRFVKYIYSF